MKRAITIFFVLMFLGLAQAHEFWLLPSKFRYEVGDQLIIDFMAGENFEGGFWDLKKNKVEKLKLVNRIGEIDLTGKEKRTAGNNLNYALNNVGTHLVTLQSGEAYLESEPSEFDEYLSEDGLEYIKDERARLNEEDNTARELYSRYAKLLVQVGDRTDNTFSKITGLKYEIVPIQNPYDLKAGDYMDCKVLYRGNPEPHALVKVWNHIGNRTFLQNIYTESDGTIRFPISNNGSWMVSSVKMIRSNSQKAEWESMWGSLVFGIE